MKHICVDCEKEFDGPEIPEAIKEIAEALMCPDCAKKEGLPTTFPFRMAFDPNPKQKE